MTIYPNDMLGTSFLLGAIEERPFLQDIKDNYIWRTYFPEMTTSERKLSWDSIRSEHNLAGFYDVRGAAVPIQDDIFQTMFANLIDVKASKVLDPDVMSKVRAAGELAVTKPENRLVSSTQAKVAAEVQRALAICDNAVEATLEYMAMGALKGTVEWPPKDNSGNTITAPMPHWNAAQTFSVNFPRYSNFDQDATTLVGHASRAGTQISWAAAGANPVRDLEVISELMAEQEGINMQDATILMTRATLSEISHLDSVLNWLNGATIDTLDSGATLLPGAAGIAGVGDVQRAFVSKLGLNIQVYNGQWTYRTENPGDQPTINRVSFLKRGEVLIIPKSGSTVGNMAFGEFEGTENNWVYGKYPQVYFDNRTKVREMEVRTVAWPVIYRGQEVFKLDAFS